MNPVVIHLHREAPPKPPAGAPCNGCGACCALEPCPVGMLVSLRRRGRCRALRWHEAERRYRCGLMPAPGAGGAWAGWRARWRARLAARWIAAGAGCDAGFDIVAGPSSTLAGQPRAAVPAAGSAPGATPSPPRPAAPAPGAPPRTRA